MPLPVDADRLWDEILALAAITDPEKRYTRRPFGALFSQGREWLDRRFAEAGLKVRIDAAGNLIGRREGAERGLKSIMLGSHSDTPYRRCALHFSRDDQELRRANRPRESGDLACAARGRRTVFAVLSDGPPATCDAVLRAELRHAARRLGLSARELASGAGHDAAFMTRICPTAMIFTPCRAGKSHASEE